MPIRTLMITLLAAMSCCTAAAAPPLQPHQQQARELLQRLVAFRSAAGHGQVPAMTDAMVEALRAGGIAAADIERLPLGDTTALLVRLPGREPDRRPLLFSAHMDVVDARPADWQRDPFTLVEEDGWFFGRGTLDNKAGVVALLSTLLRFRADGRQPRRTLVFAFVGDEETEQRTTALIAAHPWVRDAEFAINTDAGGGRLAADGRPLIYLVQGAEKTYASFDLQASNPGGHSSRPRSDNAIYDLARALLKVEAHRFPVMATPLTRGYLGAVGATMPGPLGAALRRFGEAPDDPQAIAVIEREPEFAATLRTTCVATMLEGGHAENALPQRATATINCRIFPGVEVDAVREALLRAIDDPGLALDVRGEPSASPVSEPRADVTAAITAAVHRFHPGVPVAPYLESGGTDGKVYRSAGIPTWGSSGIFIAPEAMFAHGLDERLPVAGFYQGLEHIHELALTLGEQ
jgi:carboxypeptidase PM20D1